MDDVENGSYLRAGGIWTELNRRRGAARVATIKTLLINHLTRTQYEESRTGVLQLISRKIGYKEHLINRQDSEFTGQLNKSITSVESEINALLSFVMAFDQMAELMQAETAGAVDAWYTVNQQNMILTQLVDAERERAESWSHTAFKIADDHANHVAQLKYAA